MSSESPPEEISREQLTRLKFFSLKNFRQIKTSFVFIDECGSLSDSSDQYFGLGSFKIYRPSTLYPLFRSIRDKFQYKPELKFRRLSNLSLPPAKAFLTAAMANEGGFFKAMIIPKNHPDFDIVQYFNNDSFEVYKKFLVILLKKNINEIDLITVLADDYFAPFSPKKLESFEGGVRALTNSHFERLAVTGICQISSNSSDFIQLVDLILGCVMFDLKIQKRLIEPTMLTGSQQIKFELLNHFKDIINMPRNEFFFQWNGMDRKRYSPRSKKVDLEFFTPRVVHEN